MMEGTAGTQPGFDTLDNLGPAILITGWTGFGLSAIVVGLRLYVRLGITKSRLADHDYVMTSALVGERCRESKFKFR